MNIDPGELDKRITLLAPKTVVDDGGDDSNTFTTLGTVWAKAKTGPGLQQIWQGEQATGVSVIQWIMRYEPYGAHLTTKHRVQYHGRIMEIANVESVDEDQEFIRLTCREAR